MPSDKSTQSSQEQKGSDHNVEIITPLKVRSGSGKEDSSRPRRFTIVFVSLLFIVLLLIAAGGFFFIRLVSKHPVKLSDDSGQTVQSEAHIPGKQIPDVEETTTAETGRVTTPTSDSVENQQAVEPEQNTAPAKEDEKHNKLIRLMESGWKHEKSNRFAFAIADYQEALKSYPESGEAQEALIRVKERIVSEQFHKFMSDGLTAYHKGNYQSARNTLLQAKSFRPDSEEVQNALAQVEEAIRLDTIDKLRQKAMTAEKTEHWEQALESYQSVLNIDPNIRFAVQGKERSLEHIRVIKRINFFLQKPDALESDQLRQHALLVIEEAEILQPGGPRLSVQLDELKTLVDAARTPATVIIDSDSLTEVVVYKVGKLGRFITHELSLRPGTYTVVGSRDGYKDVRQNIIVKLGQKTLRITVVCRNKV